MHWTLEMAFSKDTSRKRNKNAVQYFSIILIVALSLLKNEKSAKQSISIKRMQAG